MYLCEPVSKGEITYCELRIATLSSLCTYCSHFFTVGADEIVPHYTATCPIVIFPEGKNVRWRQKSSIRVRWEWGGGVGFSLYSIPIAIFWGEGGVGMGVVAEIEGNHSLIASTRSYFKKYQCRGVLLIWIKVGQGPTALAVGAGGIVWTFFLSSIFFFLSPSVGDGPIKTDILSQRAVKPQPTNQLLYEFWFI